MKTYFDPQNGGWNMRTTDRLPRHDLYFGTPVNAPTAGLPIGDGDTGTLVFRDHDGIVDERSERRDGKTLLDGVLGHVERALHAIACAGIFSCYNGDRHAYPWHSSQALMASCVVCRGMGCSAKTDV